MSAPRSGASVDPGHADESEPLLSQCSFACLGWRPRQTWSASQRRHPKQRPNQPGWGSLAFMSDQHRQALLDAAAEYVRAQLSLANAIIAAKGPAAA
jgi:hypothetical protein